MKLVLCIQGQRWILVAKIILKVYSMIQDMGLLKNVAIAPATTTKHLRVERIAIAVPSGTLTGQILALII